MKIAVIGAECTGKTALVDALAQHYQQQGRTVQVVPESLRAWCQQQGRTPRADEQTAIAQEQVRRFCDAIAQHPATIIIADTTPLMTAVYSEWYFNDTSLYGLALAHQAQYDITLLAAPDLPWVADGIQRDGEMARLGVDGVLRRVLADVQLPYVDVAGQGTERLRTALVGVVGGALAPNSSFGKHLP